MPAPPPLLPTASPAVAVLGKAVVGRLDELTDTLVEAARPPAPAR